MRAIRDGVLPEPPMARLIDFRLRVAEPGRIVMELEPHEGLENTIGLLHGATAAALLDTAMGCAISTMLPAGQGAVTLDLKLTYLRPLSVRSGTISAEGKVIKLGRQTSYAEGSVRDGAGNLAVHATATFSMVGEAEGEIGAAFSARNCYYMTANISWSGLPMRYSKEHKLETHARIVKKASVRLREKGAHGIGVADLMKDAGLTHGGFYAHFNSREALVIEAFSYAMDRSTERWRKLAEETPPEKRLATIVEAYLTPVHRDDPGHGCAVPTLGAGNRPREPEDPQGVRGQAGADDRDAGRSGAGTAAQGRAQAGDRRRSRP